MRTYILKERTYNCSSNKNNYEGRVQEENRTSVCCVNAPIFVIFHIVVHADYTVPASHAGQRWHFGRRDRYRGAFFARSFVRRRFLVAFAQGVSCSLPL